MADIWYALDVSIEVVAREAVEYALMEGGALGTQFEEGQDNLAQVRAYFSEVPNRQRIREFLADALRIYSLNSSSVREMQLAEIENQDWLAEWKKIWQPITVGERFVIAPSWFEISDSHDRIVIRIEPGMAFGTGTHETTRLCLEAIEKHFAGGSFLDVGAGTGILAIAAAKLFPASRVSALDIDAQAIDIAKENARLNGVSQIEFLHGSVGETTPSSDLVCANLTAPVILELLPKLLGATCRRLVLSGILESQSDLILVRLREQGIAEPIDISVGGEWVAIVV